MLEKIMTFISESEFWDLYGLQMKDIPELKQHIVELVENGKPIRGIAVRSLNHPHRQLHVFSTFQSMLCERLHDASSQLRELQGEEAWRLSAVHTGKRRRGLTTFSQEGYWLLSGLLAPRDAQP